MNRRQDEFSSLRAYNDFLEQRESIVANLVCRTDVAQTEAQLSDYAAANAASIKRNKRLQTHESASFQESQSAEQEAMRRSREAARQESDSQRRAKAAGREGLISRLAAGSKEDADTIARDARRDAGMLKKKKAAAAASRGGGEAEGVKRKLPGAPPDAAAATSEAGGADLVRGLKREATTPEPERPYDPFDGHAWLMQRDYFTPADSYPSRYLEPIRSDVRMLAGGYDLGEYYARSLVEAFSGLGCFVDEELRGSQDMDMDMDVDMQSSATAMTEAPG